MNQLPQIPHNTPYADVPGEPISTDVQALRCNAVQVYSLIVDGKPALGFVFVAGDRATTPIVLTHLEGLRELIGQALDTAMAHDGWAAPAQPSPTSAAASCPGCDRRLFGDRITAGVCTTCAEAGA